MKKLIPWFFTLIFFVPISLYSYEDSVEKRLNLWPLVVYSKHKNRGYERKEFVGPFIYQYKFEDENGTSIRPLVSSVNKIDQKNVYFLSPLGIYHSDNETSTYKLIPLINRRIDKQPQEEKEGSKWEYFPIFYGKTAQNETYGGVFPIYGKFKKRFGREEVTFILWPFYSKVKYEEYTAYNILWPFIRVAKSHNDTETKYEGFKFWPFYGHFKEGDEERKFLLWPFYIKDSYKDDTGNFEEKTWYFPFYGKEKTDLYDKTFYAWPFFQKVCTHDFSYCQIDAPWPFYRCISGKNIYGKRFWPLYGFLKREDSIDTFILWPFYFYKEDNFKNKNSTYLEREHRFLFLSKENKIYENGTLSQRTLKIWPLYYSYENHQKNLKIYYFPAILPIYDEGMERNYGALLKLFEDYEKEDYQFVKILWGLYRYEKIDQREVQELAFLVRRVRDPKANTNYLEFLEGFLGFGRIEKKPVFKLFFINLLNLK
ncbi:MAG: hypothetical protein ACP5QC_05625 [Caldimicrobium sp.]